MLGSLKCVTKKVTNEENPYCKRVVGEMKGGSLLRSAYKHSNNVST